MDSEKSLWNHKVRFFENTEEIIHDLELQRHEPISFYEGVAVLLSNGYLKSDFNEKPFIDYPAQQAA